MRCSKCGCRNCRNAPNVERRTYNPIEITPENWLPTDPIDILENAAWAGDIVALEKLIAEAKRLDDWQLARKIQSEILFNSPFWDELRTAKLTPEALEYMSTTPLEEQKRMLEEYRESLGFFEKLSLEEKDELRKRLFAAQRECYNLAYLVNKGSCINCGQTPRRRDLDGKIYCARCFDMKHGLLRNPVPANYRHNPSPDEIIAEARELIRAGIIDPETLQALKSDIKQLGSLKPIEKDYESPSCATISNTVAALLRPEIDDDRFIFDTKFHIAWCPTCYREIMPPYTEPYHCEDLKWIGTALYKLGLKPIPTDDELTKLIIERNVQGMPLHEAQRILDHVNNCRMCRIWYPHLIKPNR
jgi:hypothetical protein